MVLSFVPIKNARRDSDQVPCCGKKSHINVFVLLKKSVSSWYETVVVEVNPAIVGDKVMQMSSAVLQHILCVCVCCVLISVCVCAHAHARVRACACVCVRSCSVPAHEHFVYSNCSNSENLPSVLHNIKLVTEKVKFVCLSSPSPL
jgi:hypothetical protein